MRLASEHVEGKHVSRRDGIEYRYEVTWVNAPYGLAWSARVFVDDALFSTPSGSMAHVTEDFDAEELVRAVVHQAIERGVSKI
jgi:hypothetical protein